MKQILSQHCIYEAGDKKKGFEYYSEKVCKLKVQIPLTLVAYSNCISTTAVS